MEICPYTAAMPRKSKKPLPPRPALGVHLTALRQAAGLTQVELASLVGVSQANIAFWERGAKPPRSDVLQPMAEALGVSVEALLKPGPLRARAGRQAGPKGEAQQLFEELRKLPRRQQRRILDVVHALLTQSEGRAA